jgi:hypothetical protein
MILRTVRMPRALWERLQAFAQVWNMSASKMAQKAIRRFVRLKQEEALRRMCADAVTEVTLPPLTEPPGSNTEKPDEVTPRLQGLPGGIGPEAITPVEIRYALQSYLDEHEGEKPPKVEEQLDGWFE